MIGLILTVGFTPAKTKFSISELKPDFVCFLCSQDSLVVAADIKREVALNFDRLRVEIVDEEDPHDVIAKFNSSISWLKEKGVEMSQIVVDITSGNPAMTVAIAMTAGFLGLTIYVAHDAKMRREKPLEPDPRELEMIAIGNPYETLGLAPLRNGVDYFNRHNYEWASLFFQDLLNKTTSMRRMAIYLFLLSLTEAYKEWDLFKYDKANDLLKKAISDLKIIVKEEPNLSIIMDPLRKNKLFLQHLLAETKGLENPSPLLAVDIYQNGLRRLSQSRFNDAAVRFYRSTEAGAQFRLFKLGISTTDVDWNKIDETVIQRFQKTLGVQLPRHLAFDHSYVLLRAYEDEFGRAISLKAVRAIQFARNHSILAHMFRSLDEGEVKKIAEKAKKIIETLLKIESIEVDNLFTMVRHCYLDYEVLRSIIFKA